MIKKSVFGVLFLAAVCLNSAPSSLAFESLESASLTGVDQRFTDGYTSRISSERQHREFTFASEREAEEAEQTNREALETQESPWRYYKEVSVGMLWDQNPDGSIHDPDGDLVYSYGSVLGMRRRSEFIYFEMATANNYADWVENQKKSRYGNAEFLVYRLNFNRLKIKFTDNFRPNTQMSVGERTELVTGGEAANTPQALSTARVFTYNNDLTMEAVYTVSPKTKLTYEHLYNWYYFPTRSNSLTANSFSSKSHTFKPGIEFQITPKIKTFFNYGFNIIDYYETKGDSLHPYTHSFGTGLAWRISPKMGIGFDLGYVLRDYLTEHLENVDGITAAASLTRQLSNKVYATLSFSKEIQQNLDQTVNRTLKEDKYFYGLNLTWKFSQKILFSAQANVQDNGREGTRTLVDPENRTLFFTRPDDDQTYRWGLGVDWKPRNDLTLSLVYEFLNHNASFKDFEYEDQKALARASYRF